MSEIACVYGEDFVGDGCTYLYRDGQFEEMFDNENVSDGYVQALEDMGHSIEYIRTELGDSSLGWQEASAWWENLTDKDNLEELLKLMAEKKFTVIRRTA